MRREFHCPAWLLPCRRKSCDHPPAFIGRRTSCGVYWCRCPVEWLPIPTSAICASTYTMYVLLGPMMLQVQERRRPCLGQGTCWQHRNCSQRPSVVEPCYAPQSERRIQQAWVGEEEQLRCWDGGICRMLLPAELGKATLGLRCIWQDHLHI